MRFKTTKKEEPSLGIAPLIDIVFLLLIFFMVTSHFDIASGVRIQLPKVSKMTYEQQKDKVTLIIDKSGLIYVGGKKIGARELMKKLKYLVIEKGLIQVVLQADKDVRHGVVVETMDIAKRAGVRSIVIAARWKSGKIL
ncbi:MAG: biopolymer transporter ExbD [Deltaproteobacteria bacterium]|nr:biopolymer transporter ExbD [Deltaproteobacteria bacterium]MBW2300557.1 biopolymer transporter ExbD [Deltaproteobacteria bacterium]